MSSQPTRTTTHALFDLDGVLLDTEGLYSEAAQAIVGRFGKTFDWSVKRHMMGRDARVATRYLLEALQIPLSIDEFLHEYQAVLEPLIARSPAMPGAEAFVRSLAARGVPMAVATSSDRRLFELKVHGHAWFELFDAIVCGDDPRVVAKKPAPDIFLVAARELGASPETCVVFEDSPAGIEAGLAAGMRVVALPHPELGAEPCAAAHRIVTGWDAVLAIGLELV
jgi:HAD superfamily hydrolase (TIGR01509 family)